MPEGGQWTMAHGAAESAAMGFNAIHVDSMIWSIGLGLLFLLAVSPRSRAGDIGRSLWLNQFR